MASAALTHPGCPNQLAASDAIAAKPASASGHHGFAGASGTAASCPPALATSGVKSSERIASSTGARASGAWVTVSTRCIRLNSMPLTDAIAPSLLRIKASSVGQSICRMRIGVQTLSLATVGEASAPNVAAPGVQQLPSWSWS
ncbi:hypothetical protein SK875_p00228 (plasmid) [Burkholderia contaminans]|nr:hypothetical protein SK875_p00228 [Burkholderia contaminans]